jgi:WhiB family transcriptional regulator, redox-sensing transcriptional regulator
VEDPERVAALLPGVLVQLLAGSVLPSASGREGWREHAACATAAEPDDWYPDDETGAVASAALAGCGGCPVRWPCLAAAVAGREAEGIWGGTVPSARRAAFRALDAGAPPAAVFGVLLPPTRLDPESPAAEFAGDAA